MAEAPADGSSRCPADGSRGAHRLLLQGGGRRGVWEEYRRLRQEEHSAGGSAQLIAGAFQRTLDVRHAGLCVDTERTLRAVTLQTPGVFADLRVPCDRAEVLATRGSLDCCSPEDLRELARQVSFAGISVVRHDIPGYSGSPVCERFHAIDSNPPPRVFPNQWRIETRWERGGWIEWGARQDSHGQALYVEHWSRLAGGDGRRYVALRRDLAADHEGLLLIVGDHFLLVDDRPGGMLPPVVPGQGGQPDDRGQLLALVKETSDVAELRRLLSYCAAYGRVGDAWRIDMASWPWLEGQPLLGAEGRFRCAELEGCERVVIEEVTREGLRKVKWDILETSLDAGDLRELLGASVGTDKGSAKRPLPADEGSANMPLKKHAVPAPCAGARRLPFHILDVFADAPLGGNQLLVVDDRHDTLSAKQQHQITQEIGFAETAFIKSPPSVQAMSVLEVDVRIWTPAYEVPFAGHPSLGLAAVLASEHGSDDLSVRLRTRQGPISLRRATENGSGPADIDPVWWMQQSAPTFYSPVPMVLLAELMERWDETVHPTLRVSGATTPHVSTGLPYLLVRTAGPSQLRAARPVQAGAEAVMAKLGLDAERHPERLHAALYLFCFPGSGDERVIQARMFCWEPKDGGAWGWVEDAATGSAAGCLAAQLAKDGHALPAVVHQGEEMGRPSVLHIDAACGSDASEWRVRVGGRVQHVASGMWETTRLVKD